MTPPRILPRAIAPVWRGIVMALVGLLCLPAVLAAQDADDRYVGYYYPPITSEEVFERKVRVAPSVGRAVRVDFINTITDAQLKDEATPRFVFFAKGQRADELILVALDDEVFATLFRARAILAQLTVNVRRGGFFAAEDLQTVATFFDLLQLLEFDTLVISDGKTWSHRVDFKRE